MGNLLCTPQTHTKIPPATTTTRMQGTTAQLIRAQNIPPEARHNPNPNNRLDAHFPKAKNRPADVPHIRKPNNSPNAQHINKHVGEWHFGKQMNPFEAQQLLAGERYFRKPKNHTLQIDGLKRELKDCKARLNKLEQLNDIKSINQRNKLQNSINELKSQIRDVENQINPAASGSTSYYSSNLFGLGHTDRVGSFSKFQTSGSTSAGPTIRKSKSLASRLSSSNFAESSPQAQASARVRRSMSSSNLATISSHSFFPESSTNRNSTFGPRMRPSSMLMDSSDAPTRSTNSMVGQTRSRTTSKNSVAAPTTSRAAPTNSRASSSRYSGSGYYN